MSDETTQDARAVNPGIIKIIGIGQRLRRDDAAGLEAVRFWQEIYLAGHDRSRVQVELAEAPGIELLSLLEGASIAILVDAVRSGARPGRLYSLREDQLDEFTAGSGSAHGWGVAETLSVGRHVIPSAMPLKLVLVGIEAGAISLGEGLSREVQSAIPEAARMIEQHIHEALLCR